MTSIHQTLAQAAANASNLSLKKRGPKRVLRFRLDLGLGLGLRCILSLGLSFMPILSSNAWALELGRPLMLSKQGEPLKVEMGLGSISADELRGLQVNIAPLSAYQSRHLEDEALSLSAMGVKAKLTQNNKGLEIIRLSSDKPVNQSFLSVLLELQWSTGSETREWGLLLDAGTKASTPQDHAIVVQEGETASSIAQQFASSPITYEQMLIALLRANPKSFVNQNINRLRANATLRIPSQAQALSTPLQQAKEELKAQNLDFEQYRQNLAQKINSSKSSLQNGTPQTASGLISPKVQAPVSGNQDQLKLSNPSSKAAKANEQMAKELQAKDTLKATRQVQDNLKELGQLADQSASLSNQDASQEGVIAAQSMSLKSRVSTWLQHPLMPVLSGLLFGFLVLLTLWKTKSRSDDENAQESMDPLNRPSSIFDLETPIPHSLRATPAPLGSLGPQVLNSHPAANHQPNDPDELTEEDLAPMPQSGAVTHGLTPSQSLKDHVNIDFDLELPELDGAEPSSSLTNPITPPLGEAPTVIPEEPFSATANEGGFSNTASHPASESFAQDQSPTPAPQSTFDLENPLQVRFDLAQELWQVGQHHTARAIVQEVANQASGTLLEQSLAWLNDRP